MYRSYKVTVTSKTTPTLLFATATITGSHIKQYSGSPNDPIPVTVFNFSTTVLYIGGRETATCVFPLTKKSSKSFGIIGGESLYAKSSSTTPQAVYVLIGRQ